MSCSSNTLNPPHLLCLHHLSLTLSLSLKAYSGVPSSLFPLVPPQDHLDFRESIWDPSPARSECVLSSISSLVSLLCSGSAPPEVTPHLCGATLLAHCKKDGGVRPIAVGEVLRRLVSKCLSSVAAPLVSTILPPHQVPKEVPKPSSTLSSFYVLTLSSQTQTSGFFWLISGMRSTILIEPPCLRSFNLIYQVSPHGCSVAMAPNLTSFMGIILSIAVLGYSRKTPWGL